MTKIKKKEITFRHWFVNKFGTLDLGQDIRSKYILPANIAELERLFRKDFPSYSVSFNSIKKYANNLKEEIKSTGTFVQPELSENIDMSVIKPYDFQIKPKIPYEQRNNFSFDVNQLSEIGNTLPKIHKTGFLVDQIDSTVDSNGGLYGGTITVVTGEPGIGKTSLLIDKLVKYKNYNPDCSVLFINSDMIRSDLLFYKEKLPAIGNIEVLHLFDYWKKGYYKKAIEHSFNNEYDIIVIDSCPGLIYGLSNYEEIDQKEALLFVLEMIIKSTEMKGTAVICTIESLLKNDSDKACLLKDTSTAILELKKDNFNRTYMQYIKNRRSNSKNNKKLYFQIDSDKKEVVYEEKFSEFRK